MKWNLPQTHIIKQPLYRESAIKIESLSNLSRTRYFKKLKKIEKEVIIQNNLKERIECVDWNTIYGDLDSGQIEKKNK